MQLRVHADTLMQLRITDGLNVAAEAVAKADVAACFHGAHLLHSESGPLSCAMSDKSEPPISPRLQP